MKLRTKTSVVHTSVTALFSALICAGCFFSIQMPGGVPFTVQNLFVILSALILGGSQGAGATGLFLLLGIAGIPVFAGCTGGWQVFTGPTGGFLWGYFIGAFAAGMIAGTPHVQEKKIRPGNCLRLLLASAAGFILIYLPGIPWYMHVTAAVSNAVDFSTAISYALTPFISGDLIKLIISVPIAVVLRPVAARYLYPDDEKELEEVIGELKSRKKIVDKVTGKKTKKK